MNQGDGKCEKTLRKKALEAEAQRARQRLAVKGLSSVTRRYCSVRVTQARGPPSISNRRSSGAGHWLKLTNTHTTHFITARSQPGGFVNAIVHEGAHSPRARCRHCRLDVRVCVRELEPNSKHEPEGDAGLRKRVAVAERLPEWFASEHHHGRRNGSCYI
jgi:hypothetical protein